MVRFVGAGWHEVFRRYWCLSVGSVWRSVSIRLLSRWTCTSRKGRLVFKLDRWMDRVDVDVGKFEDFLLLSTP